MSKQDQAISDDVERPEQGTTQSDANTTQPPTQQQEEQPESDGS